MVKVCLRGLIFFGSVAVISAVSPLASFADPAPVTAVAPQAPPPANAPASEPPKPSAPVAQTISDPSVDVDDLKLLIEPLTKAELEVEANGWFGLLRSKVKEISEAELAVRKKNREIATLKEVKKAAKEAASVEVKTNSSTIDGAQSGEQKKAQANLAAANAKLSETVEPSNAAPSLKAQTAKAISVKAAAPALDAKKTAQQPQATNDKEILKKALESAEKTGEQLGVAEKAAAVQKEAEAASSVASVKATTVPTTPAPAATQAEAIAAKTDIAAEAKADVKVQLVDYSTKLATERTALIDRFKVVLDQLDRLGGDSKGMRAYITAVSGLKVEVSDYESTIARLKAWLTSDEGGLRWARNLALFVAYLIGAYILSKIVRGFVSRSIGKAKATSKLLQNFVVDMSGRAVMAVGLLAGLSALEIDLAPLLAVIGAAGFVVAFALQGTLSNLASGLLIMVNKPFDINDEVEVGGDIKGRVENVTIFSTLIRTEENTRKIVPNNTIWGGVIVNRSTGAVTPAHAS
jgi:small conductance mechanosensitive channel